MNALLLSVYFLVVFYVLYQMALALEKKQEAKVEIKFDNKFAAGQIQAQLNAQSGTRHTKAVAREIGIDISKMLKGAADNKGRNKGQTRGKKKDSKPKKKPVVFVVFETNTKVPSTAPEIVALKLFGMSEESAQEALQPKLIIRVSPIGRERLRSIPYMTVSIQNLTPDRQVYIYWNRSSISMFGQGHRVVRSTPNMPVDLSQGQLFSVVNPEQRVVSNINIERNYARIPDTNRVERVQPLFDLAERVEMSKLTNPNLEEENKQLLCGLDMMVGFKQATDPDSKMINVLVPISLELIIKVDQIAFPPLRWFSRHFGQKKPEGSWFWGRPKER